MEVSYMYITNGYITLCSQIIHIKFSRNINSADIATGAHTERQYADSISKARQHNFTVIIEKKMILFTQWLIPNIRTFSGDNTPRAITAAVSFVIRINSATSHSY